MREFDENRERNYLRLIDGEFPNWVPVFIDACDMVTPSITTQHMRTEDKVDMFGVPWVIEDGAAMTKPRAELLEDISKWRDRVVIPDLEAIDYYNDGMNAGEPCNHVPISL